MIPNKSITRENSSADDVTIEDVRMFFKAYGKIVLGSVLCFLLLATLYCLVATRRYGAVEDLEIQKSEVSALDAMGNPSQGSGAASASDALDFAVTQPTQVSILESDTLALQVIKELDLEPTHDFFSQKPSGASPLAWLFPWVHPLEPLSVPIDAAPNRRAKALKIFKKRLKVKQTAGTRLISITYYNPDPKLAADVVNHLAAAYIDFEFEARLNQTNEASKWLSGQLRDLKKRTEDLQANAIKLQRETGLFGEDESHNIVLARLEALNEQQTSAETNRILKEAILKAVQSGNAELISGLNGNSLNGAAALNQNSLTLIGNLRMQEAQLQPQLADYSSRYLPDHPKMIQLRAQLDSLEKAINAEVQRISERAKSDYDISLQTERAAQSDLIKQKKEANDLNDKATAYTLAKQEADDSRALYGELLGKLTQAGVLQGLKASNVVVVNPGRVPSTDDPAKPNMPFIYVLAFGAGLVLGTLSAFWIYLRSLRFPTASEIGRMWDVGLVAVLPESSIAQSSWSRRIKRYIGLPVKPLADIEPEVALDQNPWYLEALLALRTSILFRGVEKVPQVIVTSSTVPFEGNTIVGTSLATVLSWTGNRTLYVDADVRRGSASLARRSNTAQLTHLLTSESSYSRLATASDFSNLDCVDAGSPVAFSALDMLGSDRMRDLIAKWRKEYRFIVIDSSSAETVTDAAIVSSFADLLLLVARERATTKSLFKKIKSRLQLTLSPGADFGVVFDGVAKETLDQFEQTKHFSAETVVRKVGATIAASVVLTGLLFTWVSPGKAQSTTTYMQVGWLPAPKSAQIQVPPAPQLPVLGQESLMIGRGDLVAISVYGEPDMNQQVLVNDEGNIPLLIGGSVHIAGLTPDLAGKAVSDHLREMNIMQNARVTVMVYQYATQGVSVIGEVTRPGIVPITTPRKIIEVVALAGGFTYIADRRLVTIQHGSNVNDQETVLLSNDPKVSLNSNGAMVKPGDTVIIPRAPIVYVIGDVAKPGAYVMQYDSQMTILQAIAFAGGEMPDAARGQARLIRKSDEKYGEIPVHLKDMEKGKANDMQLVANDVLYIPFSLGRHILLGVGDLLPATESSAVYAAR